MRLTISIDRVTRLLAAVVILLTLANLAGQMTRYVLGHGRVLGLVDLFDTDREGNVPTWYSSAALLVCALLIAIITMAKKAERDRFWPHWSAMALIFLYLSMDEAAVIHELAIDPLRRALDADSYLHFTWVVLGIAFVGGFLIAFVGGFLIAFRRFIFALPVRTRNLFIASGGLFLSGAVGMELVGGNFSWLHGEESLAYAAITATEEFLEMSGIVLFIYALMTYMRDYLRDVRIEIRS
jgi:hypothetical protein